ncbi:hypothetical protein [Entomomonas asaccharolytica]|uniref:Uncharacterized protein n=1 Tax=Entomomonas asaccharolytica TaxID=2785331 RepID=A0A974RWR5_9GAMM|nr:hypothetical protein [Entomomonas asaccharolytica]QQP85417.1 hypothetical protein JHT90_13715 [Entomomonas asaccharolytica]
MNNPNKFIVVKVDPVNKTMVIDWGYIRLNHRIPNQILENPHLSQNEVIELIEKMRPKQPQPIEIPMGLQSLIDKTDQQLSQQIIQDEILL